MLPACGLIPAQCRLEACISLLWLTQELKEECKRLGLPVTGKKEQLVTRILEAQSHQEEEEVGESVPEAAGANATAAAPTVGNADSTADDGLAAAVDPAVTHAAGLSSGKHGKIVFAVHDDGSVEHKPPAATDRQGSMSKLIALEKASSVSASGMRSAWLRLQQCTHTSHAQISCQSSSVVMFVDRRPHSIGERHSHTAHIHYHRCMLNTQGDAAKPNPAPTAANIDKVKQLTVEERNKLREAK